MSEEEIDWTKTCWSGRFSKTRPRCLRPAKWRGTAIPFTTSPLNVQWRACDKHKMPTDIPLETNDE